MEKTYIMIKPDGVQRGFIGRIISRFEEKGFKLVGLKMLLAEESVLDEHYAELKVCLSLPGLELMLEVLQDRPFYPGLLDYIRSGPVVAMVWEGNNVVAIARQMLGATNPANSPPGTIREGFIDKQLYFKPLKREIFTFKSFLENSCPFNFHLPQHVKILK